MNNFTNMDPSIDVYQDDYYE